MSYNNIGLKTARGSGTSGHIQKNRGYDASRPLLGVYETRKQHEEQAQKSASKFAVSNVSDRNVSNTILEHDRKREIEAKCFELQDKLEDEGVDEEEVERKVDALRKELQQKPYSSTGSTSSRNHQTLQKRQENERMREAFNRKGLRQHQAAARNYNRDRQTGDMDWRRAVNDDDNNDNHRYGARYPSRSRSRSKSTSPRRKERSTTPERQRRRERSASPHRDTNRVSPLPPKPASPSSVPERTAGDPRSKRKLKAYE